MIAIKTDGTLWAWGYNASGQLGLGNTTQYGSPQQVGALTNWLSVAASGYVSSAVKSDGTLWMWGESGNGQLGLGEGSNHNHSSPTQVGTLTNWAAVSPSGGYHTLAVKTDGTLWSWGDNDKGQLGLGNSTYYSSPKQIGNLTTWQLPMTAGFCHSSFAIRTDGTLWSWGQGSYGILGLGSTANINSPLQVGALTNWSTVAAGYGHAMAIKTNGTLWGWGFPLRGDIGVGNTNYYSSPVQVGALSTWLTVAAGYGWTLATHS